MNAAEISREAFAGAAAGQGVFSSSAWLSNYDDRLKTVGLLDAQDKIIGGFYYYLDRRAGLPFVKLPPYTPHCGFFTEHQGKGTFSRNAGLKEAITAMNEHLASKAAALTVLAFPFSVIDMQPFTWSGYHVVPNYTYRLDLTIPGETLRSGFDPKHRNMISKAERDGVVVSDFNGDAAALFGYFASALSDAGANVYRAELQNVLTKFAGSGQAFCLEAQKADGSGKPAGRVFCVYDNTTCYYMFAQVDRSLQGVNNLLVARSIEKAASLGCTVFDFEGSMLPGVERFFRGFGGILTPYYTINRGWLPLEMLLKFRKRSIF